MDKGHWTIFPKVSQKESQGFQTYSVRYSISLGEDLLSYTEASVNYTKHIPADHPFPDRISYQASDFYRLS